MNRQTDSETTFSIGGETAAAGSVRGFARSGFAVRCNVVKVWRSLPPDLWTGLSTQEDRIVARAREFRAACVVLVVVLSLWLGFAHIGFRFGEGSAVRLYPLLGKPVDGPGGGHVEPGFYYEIGQSVDLVFWSTVPPLLGWGFVRLFWLPIVSSGKSGRRAAMTTARHLGSVYAYVYLMVAAGATLMVPLILLAPEASSTFRWYLWCFLFGETFFVPGVMWARLALRDEAGAIFGRFRHGALAIYLILFVVVPILGMVRELG